MLVFDETRVVKFWDNEVLLEKNLDNDAAKKILSFKKKCFEKIEAGELNIDEYHEIEMFVKKMLVNRFVDLYDIVMLYLDLSNEECRAEIEHLSNLEFIKYNVKSNAFYELMMSSIFELQSRILSLGSVKVTEEEINLPEDVEEEIEVYNDLMQQLKNPESDYVNLLKEVYRDFITTSVKNADLREKMLTLDYKIINSKMKFIRTFLISANRKLTLRKTIDVNSYRSEGLIKGRKRKNEKKVYRRN